jgi:hypothetical protein
MYWTELTWVLVAGYVLGAPLVWHIEQWWLNRKLNEVRWLYHLCFYGGVVASFFGIAWWAPPIFFFGMVLGTGIVQIALVPLCEHLLAPVRIKLGINVGGPVAKLVQLQKEMAMEARRRGLDLSKPIRDETEQERLKMDELMAEFDDRITEVGREMRGE